MPTPLSVKIVDILIIIITIVGFGLLGAMAITGIRTATSISIGGVSTQNSGASELINIPVSLRNPGPLPLDGINVAITILNESGSTLFTGGGGPISLSSGSSGQLPISIPMDLSQLSQSSLNSLVTTSQNLTLRASIQASVSSFTSFSGTFDTPYPWGAPVDNLKLGTISTTTYNQTYAKLIVPLSFNDASQNFVVSGTISGTILGSSGKIIGTISPINLNVSPQSSFSNQLTGFISSNALTQTVTLQLVFHTSFGTFTEDVTRNA